MSNLTVGIDRRPVFEDVFFDVDPQLTCPLNPKPISILGSSAQRIYGNYDFYAGTYLDKADLQSEMLRIDSNTTYQGESFTAIMGDQLRTHNTGPAITAHPSAKGMRHSRADNASYAFSFFQTNSPGDIFTRLDRNFVYIDGHAETFINIKGTEAGLTHSRFQAICNNPDSPIIGGFRSWIPFDLQIESTFESCSI